MFKTADKIHAIDIGTKSIKVVEIKSGSPPVVLKKDSLDIYLIPQEKDSVSTTTFHMSKSALSHLLRKMHIIPKQMKQVFTTLSGGQYAIKQIRVDKMPDKELISFLQYEARKILPSKDEVLFDYQILRELESQMDLLLVSTSRTFVKNHIKLLGECGIKNPIIDVPPLALFNACLLDPNYNSDKEIRLLLNIGARFTQIIIFQAGGLFVAKDIEIAGNNFTKDLSKEIQMEFEKAEILKLNQGMFSSSEPHTFRLQSKVPVKGPKPQLSVQTLVKEVQLTVRNYLNETGNERIHHWLVTGGCANDELLCQYLTGAFDNQVTPYTPEAYNYRMNASEGSNFQYTLALGLALRGNLEDDSY